MTGRVRPAAPRGPIAVALAVMGTWWLVAHNGGSGWVQTLGDVVFATLLVGIAGPALVVSRAKIRVVRSPADAVAGQPIEIEIEASTRLRLRPAEPRGPEGLGELTLIPTRRGVHDRLVVDVASAAPFALQWWTRRMVLPLPVTLHVAPRRGQPVRLPSRVDPSTGPGAELVPADLGESRGVRPYSPGDVRRHVHWPATAHAGKLMVRELEEQAAEPPTVTVSLPVDPQAAERMAEQALGTILHLLDTGRQVRVTTSEPAGTTTGPVTDRRAAGRRLARAVSIPGPGTGRIDVAP